VGWPVRPLSDTDPTTIGSYQLLGVLGNGGMGRVYMGQSRSGRPVAIKVIRPDLVDDPVFRRRFAREVAAVRAVNPLFTAAVVDSDLSAEAPWLATTYIEGPSLERWVEGHGALSPGAVLTLAAGLAEALASIHAAGLVHRDLKPSNVLLGDVGPYIIDFGVVLSPKATRMTSSLVVGTPSYMAPERIHGGEATPATDIFSLGATMFYAATGRTLVDDSDTVYAQMMHIVKARFDLDRVPGELRPMIMRCLGSDPRDRPTAAELSQMLAAAGVSSPEPGWHQAISDVPFSAVLTPRRVPRASRRRLVLAGGLVGLATVGGVAAGLIGRAVSRDDSTDDAAAGGTVLWQGRSGAEPVPIVYGAPPSSSATAAGSGGGPATGGRPEPVAVWLVPLGGRGMAAGTRAGVRAGGPDASGWNRPVSNGLAALHRWGDSVLVADGATVAKLNPATGREEFRLDTGPVRRVVVTASLAYVGAGGSTRLDPPGTADSGSTAAPAGGAYLAAVRPDGRIEWRRTGGGTPLHADDRWILTHDKVGDRVRVALHEAATGNPKWNVEFPAPAVIDENSSGAPPGGPGPGGPGGPPDGPGKPDGPPRPVYTHTWNYAQAVIIGDHVLLRDSSEIRALRLDTGDVVWGDTAPTPVTDLNRVGDLVLVASDRVNARRADTGARVWASEPPGARIAVAPGRLVVIAGPDGRVRGVTPTGERVWQVDLPPEAMSGQPDRLLVDGDQVIITMAPQAGTSPQPGAVDVVALAL
jgi:predicted Ser/Thr protein kinase